MIRRRNLPRTLDESCRLGIDSLDRGLESLLSCLGDLMAVVEGGLEEAAIGNAIDMLDAYARRQFSIEERMMAGVGYHELETHRSHHRYFIARLEHLKRDWKRDRRLPEESLSFFANWVIAHITAIDRSFGEFASIAKRYDSPVEAPTAHLWPSEGRP